MLMEPEFRSRAHFQRAYPALVRYAHYRGLSNADADDLEPSTLDIAWTSTEKTTTELISKL
jgi:hypothetical protein